MPPSWHPVPACSQRLCCRRAIHRCSNDGAAAIRKFGPEIQNHCTLEGVSGQIPAVIPKSEPKIKNHCSDEAVSGQSLAAIPKFTPEIKNQCTQEGVNGENPASIRKSDPEIKNRCTQEGLNRENPASTLVRQWRQKRVLMRPEAAFPYVFAAEGAQHPPNKPPRSTTRRNKPTATNPPQRARFGKEEENLHFCRRKCKIKKERPTSPST